MLSLADFAASNQGVVGGGDLAQAEVLNQLNKALEAGNITGRETTNLQTASGAPLKVESLERTLKLLTFKDSDITLWRTFPKSKAFNTVEEYNQLVSYGPQRGGFYLEGELPETEDSIYTRRAQLVKFLGVTRSVTHPMTLVNTHIGNIVQKEISNGTYWLLRLLNKQLAFADSNSVPEEFNGMYAQHAANDAFGSLDAYFNSILVVDLRGATLKEENIENGALAVIENFGQADTLYGPPKVLSDFAKNFYGNKFIVPNTPSLTDGVMGQRVKEFESQFGNISLNYDKFLSVEPPKTSTAGASHPKAPAAPTVPTTGAVVPVAADPSSRWTAVDAGNYFFAVAAINRFGESPLSVLNPAAVAAIVSGGSVGLTFTATASPNPTTGFVIYRSNRNPTTVAASTFFPLFKVSLNNLTNGYDGGAAGVVRDRNRFMPNTEQAFLIENNQDIYDFKQLAPLMKMDLAILQPAYRFMLLCYGTPILFNPRKMVRFINIGKS